jgi:hypothetical protein
MDQLERADVDAPPIRSVVMPEFEHGHLSPLCPRDGAAAGLRRHLLFLREQGRNRKDVDVKVKLHDGTYITCEPEALAPSGAGRAIELGRDGLLVDPPTDGSERARAGLWPTRILGPQLVELFGRASPPTANEWSEALTRLADRVVACTSERCSDGFFPLSDGVAPVCPWCSTPLELRDHTPVLHLYQELGDAQYEPEPHAWIAGTEGRKLYPWHIAKGAASAAPTEGRAMAEVEYNDGIWGLRNHALAELRVIRNGRADRVVPIGDVVTLHDGLALLLAPAPRGRAIVVSRFEH